MRCTCGSGGHPRQCDLHPYAYEAHCAELSLDGVREELVETRCAWFVVNDLARIFDIEMEHAMREAGL